MDYLKRTWAQIDIDALLHNFETIKKQTNSKIAAVIKANAYGHGAATIAPFLEKAGASMFAVSNIEEAFELRRSGIKKDIIILGYTPAEYAESLANEEIIQTVYSLSYASALSQKAVECGVTIACHLKLDTGMSRLGFDCRNEELCGFADMIKTASLPGLKITGAFTHFATADRSGDENGEFTAMQYERFSVAVERLRAQGIELRDIHCCNSAGLMLDCDKHATLTRPGIILYGLMPDTGMEKTLPLLPVMNFYSTVSFVKTIKKGDTVSYGRHFTASHDMKVATVSVGYADGYPRALSCKGYMLINGKKAPILGNVCMDQTVVDVSEIEDVAAGTLATLWGEGLPAEEIASICDTIGYELVCGVSHRVPRVYKKDGNETEVVNYILDK
ncbi:MAG: alanine racemase [Clostridia bacterium]|nr:alanine racemase [Clostridia bacterium]